MGIDAYIFIQAEEGFHSQDMELPFPDIHLQTLIPPSMCTSNKDLYESGRAFTEADLQMIRSKDVHGTYPKVTHEVETPWRYWSPDYPRGPWARISGLLLFLLADAGVRQIWYGPDTGSPLTWINFDSLTKLNREYVEMQFHGS